MFFNKFLYLSFSLLLKQIVFGLNLGMTRLSFSGHESFICKQFWLKKGVDFVANGENSFSKDQAVVSLGVGKNMVRAIRFWLRAFQVTTEDDQITELGEYLFLKGKDPYLEAIGSIWLLHYHLVSSSRASLYNIVFNEYRRIKPEFKFDQLQRFIERYCEEADSNAYNKNTAKRDIRVFLNNYLPPSQNKKSQIEDSFSGLLYELQLVNQITKEDIIKDERVTYYSIGADFRDSLPWQVVLFSILDNNNFGNTITFHNLYSSQNSPGNVFALNQEGLFQKIKEICENVSACSFSETAGNRVLQISKPLEKFAILDGYYN